VVFHLRAQGLEEGDEHHPTLTCGAWLTSSYLTQRSLNCQFPG